MLAFMRALLIGSLCVVFSGVAQAAEAPATEPSQSPIATDGDAPPSGNPLEIEQVIAQIVPPVDHAQVERLTVAIKNLGDPTEQERLQQLLNARVSKVAQWITPETPDEVIIQHLDASKLEADVTAEDLDAREELWSAISRMSDAKRQERFMRRLEERERQAGTLIEAPKSTEPQNGHRNAE